ncbi:MAG TPA: hypothetical protein PLQ36_01445 [Candidatus Gracilibacteria bacterium]|nr:hypothetical protein [Candidatus Gracilibacteria bacterium]
MIENFILEQYQKGKLLFTTKDLVNMGIAKNVQAVAVLVKTGKIKALNYGTGLNNHYRFTYKQIEDFLNQ